MILARKAPSPGFDRPGGNFCAPSDGRPVDLDHLRKQTFDDRDLAEEVLRLFCTQAERTKMMLATARRDERRSLAHALKGSALGIGANRAAAIARVIENDPANTSHDADLVDALDEVRNFVASIFR